MALPRVTPGTYNYGDYANPTPIRYSGGQQAIGAAIGKGLQAVGQAIGQAKAQKKADEKADQLLIAKTMQDALSRVSKDARKKNTAEVTKFANQASQLAVDFRAGRVDADTYTQGMTLINDALDELNTIEALKNQINLDNVSPAIIKDTTSLNNYALQMQLQNGEAVRIWDDSGEVGQWVIEYNAINPEKINAEEIKSLNGLPDSVYEKKRIPVSEITANPKNFFSINTKFSFVDHIGTIDKFIDSFNKDDVKIYRTAAKNGYEYLNEAEALTEYKDSSAVQSFANLYGKDIAEDILNETYNSEDAEQQERIRTAIAQQVVFSDKVVKTGNKLPEEKTQVPDKAALGAEKIVQTFYNNAQGFGFEVNPAGELAGSFVISDKNIKKLEYTASQMGYSDPTIIYEGVDDEGNPVGKPIGVEFKNINTPSKKITLKDGDTAQEVRNKFLFGMGVKATEVEQAISNVVQQNADLGPLPVIK